MAELRNCPNCGGIFNYNGLRDMCPKCVQIEDDIYEKVYKFLRKRENRAASVERIVEATDVTPELLYKWIREKRLHTAMFPNLGYPCDMCGNLTQSGKLCRECQDKLKEDLKTFDSNIEFQNKKEKRTTYLSNRD